MDIQELFRIMVDKNASDLYLTVARPSMYRIEGVINPVGDHDFESQELEDLAQAIMNERQRKEFAETMEMNLAMSLAGVSRFRVNVFRQRGSVGMVIRRVNAEVATLDQLGMPPIIKEISMSKRGLTLLVGSTGSGKSTTLAGMVDHRNSVEAGHIITIEDPIEFVHRHKKSIVTQREVGFDTQSFQSALKNTLRQAPDVILIGEIRDRETMDYAIAFAETGHLCLSTLHANSANQALDRIINFFPEDRRDQLLMDLSLNLKAFISQRLLPRREAKGRVAAVEIMLNSPLIADLIFKGAVHEIKEIMAKSRELGMQTFDQHLFELYEAGLITYEDSLRNADSLNDLRLKIKLHGQESKDRDIMSGIDHLDII